MRITHLLLIAATVVSVHGLVLPFRVPQVTLNLGKWVTYSEDSPDDGYMNNPQFELWLETQKNRSFDLILENIGGISTSLDSNVAPGAVLASPSKSNPNYFYNWIRDSALTIRTLIYHMDDHWNEEATCLQLQEVIENYIELNFHLQRIPNRSGRFDSPDRAGLGEPKFMPDGSAFDSNWGRPQSDGPGLRVSTIANYVNVLERADRSFASEFLGNLTFVYEHIVRPDLEYVMANWENDAFDLWEEINAKHLFNSLTQLRALADGIKLAEKAGEDKEFVDALRTEFQNLKQWILHPSSGFTHLLLPYLVETPALVDQKQRSGLDAASLLAALHAHNIEYGNTGDIPFDVTDTTVLNTIGAMVADMKYRYPINHDRIRLRQNIGVGLGRYPEDVYDGYGTSEGNPWFISTASAAEVVFKWIFLTIDGKKDIEITPFNRDFLGLFTETSEESIAYGTDSFRRIVIAMFNYSDSFLDIIRSHIDDKSGAMLEQFNKYHGFMQGAEKLTWSFSSLYNCARWRLKASTMIDTVKQEAY